MAAQGAVHSQLEHLQAKYVGTGHADTTKFEWAVNQHRDSLALYVGFDSLTQYIAVAENEAVGRVKFNCLQVRAARAGGRPVSAARAPSPRPAVLPPDHSRPARPRRK